MVPGVSLVDGSFSLSFSSVDWHWPHNAVEWINGAAYLLRIPTQVVAMVFLGQIQSVDVLTRAKQRNIPDRDDRWRFSKNAFNDRSRYAPING